MFQSLASIKVKHVTLTVVFGIIMVTFFHIIYLNYIFFYLLDYVQQLWTLFGRKQKNADKMIHVICIQINVVIHKHSIIFSKDTNYI